MSELLYIYKGPQCEYEEGTKPNINRQEVITDLCFHLRRQQQNLNI